jgi:transcriptional regulator with XRE-family HTH domain
MKIGKLLKIYCDINNIGLRELATELGISHSTLSRVINGNGMDSQTMQVLINWLFMETNL